MSTTTTQLPSPLNHILAFAVASSYVAAVYISNIIAPPRQPLWRDDPAVIKTRSVLASLSSLLSCVLVWWAVRSLGDTDGSFIRTIELLGLPSSTVVQSLKAYFIVPALFLGPLFATYLEGSLPFQKANNVVRMSMALVGNWQGFRNFIMGPVSEEVTYRACLLSIYTLAGTSRAVMIWAVPCWFGLAHVHHAVELYKKLIAGSRPSRDAMKITLIRTAFQFAYTTLFGWLCSFLFLRTGSILVPITAHVFCNIMGFPQLTNEIQEFPHRKYPLIFAYLTGIGLFFHTLFRWSETPQSIHWT